MIGMRFKDIQFSEIDYEWFSMMPTDEKLIFIYSALLTPEEMVNFIDNDLQDDNEIPQQPDTSDIFNIIGETISDQDDLIPLYNDIGELYTEVVKNMTNYYRLNIVFVNNYIIINSDSIKIINKSRDKFFNDGFIIKKIEDGISHTGGYKYMHLYELVSSVTSISTN